MMAIQYKGFNFQTKLMAQWAVFFDLANWDWQPMPAAVGSWVPDFKVQFACSHSECSGNHSLLVSVLAIDDIAQTRGHPALEHRYSVRDDSGRHADAGALFGNTPDVTYWEMSHGAGGGADNVPFWVPNADRLWSEAQSILHTLQPGLSAFAQRCIGSDYVCKSWRTSISPDFLLDHVTNPERENGRCYQTIRFSNGGSFNASWKNDGSDLQIIEILKLVVEFHPEKEEGTYSLEFRPT